MAKTTSELNNKNLRQAASSTSGDSEINSTQEEIANIQLEPTYVLLSGTEIGQVSKTSELINDSGFAYQTDLDSTDERVTALENKVDNDTIYDDTALTNRVIVLENKVDNDTIYDDTELKNRVAAIEEKEEGWNSKVDVDDLASVATSGDYSDLTNTPTIPSLNGYATEQWVESKKYLTEHQSLADYTKTSGLAAVALSGEYGDLNNTPTIPSLDGYATESWVEGKGYLTEHQSLADYATSEQVKQAISIAPHLKLKVVDSLPSLDVDMETVYLVKDSSDEQNYYSEYLYTTDGWELLGSQRVDLSPYVKSEDLAAVATSGEYSDLNNTPEIPEAYDDTAVKDRLTAIEGKESEWDAKQDALTIDEEVTETSNNPVSSKAVATYHDTSKMDTASNTGTTGQVLTKTDDGAEWQDASGGSGGKAYTNGEALFLGDTITIDSVTYKIKEYLWNGKIGINGWSTSFSDIKMTITISASYMSNTLATLNYSLSSAGTLNVSSSTEKKNSMVYVKYISTETI